MCRTNSWILGTILIALEAFTSNLIFADVEILNINETDPFSLLVDNTHIYWNEVRPPDCRLNRMLKDGSSQASFFDIHGCWLGQHPDLAQDNLFIYMPDHAIGNIDPVVVNGSTLRSVAKIFSSKSNGFGLLGFAPGLDNFQDPFRSIALGGDIGPVAVNSGFLYFDVRNFDRNGRHEIRRIPNQGALNLGQVEVIATLDSVNNVTPRVTSLTTDNVFVYWTQFISETQGSIRSAPLRGGIQSIIVNLEAEPDSLVVPTSGGGSGSLFWLDRNSNSSITLRQSLVGGQVITLASDLGIRPVFVNQFTARALAVDNTHVFFFRRINGDAQIARVTIGAGEVSIVAQGSDVTDPRAIVASGDFVYWTDGESGSDNGTVKRVRKTELNPPTQNFTLTLQTSGSGGGSINTNPASANNSYLSGTLVILTPVTNSGSRFARWQGDCTGSGGCIVIMGQNRTVTAVFEVDTDNDGVSDNSDAFPLDPNETTDTDNDGMGDNFEMTHGLDPLDGSDAGLDADGDGLTNLNEFILGTDPEDANSTAVDPSIVLATAVLPSSRSVSVGNTATAFATIINAGSSAALACRIRPITSIAANFFFQTTDPATNALSGTRDATVNIAPGVAQSFIFGFTPTAAFGSTDVRLQYRCANVKTASVINGLNTLLLSASNTPIPDIVALVATVTNDGIVHIPGATGTGFFAMASVNVGASDTLLVSVDTGSTTLPIVTSICETNPTTGACTNPTTPTTGNVTLTISANATPTFSVFVQGMQDIAFDPANKRVFVRFKDAGGVTRGSTSVAVQTDTD